MGSHRNWRIQPATHEETLVEAIGRCCGYVIDDPLRKQMANCRLRVRAGSSLGLIGASTTTIRHPMGRVKRLRSTSRLLLPPTKIYDEPTAEQLCGSVVHILDTIPERNIIRDEACGVFEELVTNAIQHGTLKEDPRSSICSAAIEYSIYRNIRLISIAVYDNGAGLETLRANNDDADEASFVARSHGFWSDWYPRYTGRRTLSYERNSETISRLYVYCIKESPYSYCRR